MVFCFFYDTIIEIVILYWCLSCYDTMLLCINCRAFLFCICCEKKFYKKP